MQGECADHKCCFVDVVVVVRPSSPASRGLTGAFSSPGAILAMCRIWRSPAPRPWRVLTASMQWRVKWRTAIRALRRFLSIGVARWLSWSSLLPFRHRRRMARTLIQIRATHIQIRVAAPSTSGKVGPAPTDALVLFGWGSRGSCHRPWPPSDASREDRAIASLSVVGISPKMSECPSRRRRRAVDMMRRVVV